MKKFLNIVASVIVSVILLVTFLGTSLSYEAGKSPELGTSIIFIILLIVFVFTMQSSFNKHKETGIKNISTSGRLIKIFYYIVLSLGLIFAIGVALLYFLMK